MLKIIIISAIILLIIMFLLYCLYSRRYSVPCPSWLAWLIETDNPFTKINQTLTILEHLEIKPGMIVLDIGCGLDG